MTQRARKRDFRDGSISEFFNSIDVKLPFEIAMVDVPRTLGETQCDDHEIG
jgi:hypothetical protein